MRWKGNCALKLSHFSRRQLTVKRIWMGDTNVSCHLTVPDPDLEIKGRGRAPRAPPLDPPPVKILGFLSVVS